MFSIFSNDGLLCDPKIIVPVEFKEDEDFAKRQEVLEQKHKYDQPNVVQEEGYKGLFCEACNQPVINYVNDGFKKDFGPPIYDEYEEDYLGVIPKKPTVYNEELNHGEEDEGSRMGVSFGFSNSKFLCQEEIFLLDPIEKMHEMCQIINSEFFNEIVDISCTSFQEDSLHDSLEEQFGNMQVDL